MKDAAKSVTRKRSGSYGHRGADSEALQGWLLKFLEDRKILCSSVDNSVEWIPNKSLPWTDYDTFISDHLFALDKQPVICPVRVGKTWRHLFDKIVIKVTESTIVCQDDQLYVRIKVGAAGAVHRVQDIWDTMSTIEDW